MLRIHDLNGRLVRSIALGSGRTGTLWWDGDDGNGRSLSAGIYFATLAARDASVTRKIVLVTP